MRTIVLPQYATHVLNGIEKRHMRKYKANKNSIVQKHKANRNSIVE